MHVYELVKNFVKLQPKGQFSQKKTHVQICVHVTYIMQVLYNWNKKLDYVHYVHEEAQHRTCIPGMQCTMYMHFIFASNDNEISVNKISFIMSC